MTDSAAFEDWIAEARAVTVAAELERRGVRVLHEINGPCPAPGCGGRDRFAVNTRKDVFVCRQTGAGGDAIALCQHLDGLGRTPREFLIACETLTGRPAPGRAEAESEAERQARHARLAAAAEEANRRRADQELAADSFREAERRRAHDIWRAGKPIPATIAESYLRLRGIEPFDGLRLRFLPDAPLWDRPAPHGRVIHRGPAMLAPIVRGGRFAGVHQTFIDLGDPDGKARVADEAGELLPAKKIRGTKRGGLILLGPMPAAPVRAYLGEGIETVLSVRQALVHCRPHLAEGALFAAAVDLGNLAGRAAASRRHPEIKLRDKLGRDRPQRVAGPEPDAEPPAIALPAGVRELVLLGDGDSEPVATAWAMERARARFERAGEDMRVAVAMAPAGRDFNNLLRERERAA